MVTKMIFTRWCYVASKVNGQWVEAQWACPDSVPSDVHHGRSIIMSTLVNNHGRSILMITIIRNTGKILTQLKDIRQLILCRFWSRVACDTPGTHHHGKWSGKKSLNSQRWMLSNQQINLRNKLACWVSFCWGLVRLSKCNYDQPYIDYVLKDDRGS